MGEWGTVKKKMSQLIFIKTLSDSPPISRRPPKRGSKRVRCLAKLDHGAKCESLNGYQLLTRTFFDVYMKAEVRDS